MEQSWNAELYDKKHGFVSNYGNEVLEWLDPNKEEQILDLGCGTGDIVKELHDAGVKKIKGIDASENMIMQAREKYPDLSFDVKDATMMTFEEEFDAVFSNAVLHWVKEPDKALDSIYRSLKSGGRFVAEFGGKGNVQTIVEEIKKEFVKNSIPYDQAQFPWFFPSIGEYTTLMEKAGFRVIAALHFDRPTKLEGESGLQNWLDMFGQFMFQNLDDDTITRIMNNVEQNLKSDLWIQGEWVADYKRIRVKGLKE